MELVEANNGGRHRGILGIACPCFLFIGMPHHENSLVVLEGSLNLFHLIMGWLLLAGQITGNVGRGDKEIILLQMSEGLLEEPIGGTLLIEGIDQSQDLLFVQSLGQLLPVEELRNMVSDGRNTAHLKGRPSFGSIDPLQRGLMRVSRKDIKIGKSVKERTPDGYGTGCKGSMPPIGKM
jgi:hypothetical protein